MLPRRVLGGLGGECASGIGHGIEVCADQHRHPASGDLFGKLIKRRQGVDPLAHLQLIESLNAGQVREAVIGRRKQQTSGGHAVRPSDEDMVAVNARRSQQAHGHDALGHHQDLNGIDRARIDGAVTDLRDREDESHAPAIRLLGHLAVCLCLPCSGYCAGQHTGLRFVSLFAHKGFGASARSTMSRICASAALDPAISPTAIMVACHSR